GRRFAVSARPGCAPTRGVASIMMTVLMIAFALLAAIVLFLGFLLLGTLRSLGVLRWRMELLEATTPSRLGRGGLRVGKRAPDFSLSNPIGSMVALHEYAGRKVLLVFMQVGCSPCQRIIPELNRVQDAGEAQVLVVQNGDVDEVRKWIAQHQPRF